MIYDTDKAMEVARGLVYDYGEYDGQIEFTAAALLEAQAGALEKTHVDSDGHVRAMFGSDPREDWARAKDVAARLRREATELRGAK